MQAPSGSENIWQENVVRYDKEIKAKRKTALDRRKAKAWQCTKAERHSSHRSRRQCIQWNFKKCAKEVGSVFGLCSAVLIAKDLREFIFEGTYGPTTENSRWAVARRDRWQSPEEIGKTALSLPNALAGPRISAFCSQISHALIRASTTTGYFAYWLGQYILPFYRNFTAWNTTIKFSAVEFAGKTGRHFPMASCVREECPASGFLSQWLLIPHCDCYTVVSFRGTLPFLFVCGTYHVPTPMILASRHLHFVLWCLPRYES